MSKDITIRVVGIMEASKIFGLSQWELRQGVKNGKYPAFRVGGKKGKLMFNVKLLTERIEQLMKKNLKEVAEDEEEYFIDEVGGIKKWQV